MLLVERGFFESRVRAQGAIAAGLVTADGRTVRKGAELLDPAAAITASAPHPWVSRGGVKLAAALDAFRVDPSGLVCLDIGASTGGFTEVLLDRQARRVFAVDVGRGQLHSKVAGDPRVVSLEGLDARALDEVAIPEPVDLLVADVSFISLRLVLPAAMGRLAHRAALVALIKPQFEAGPKHLKKGIVRDVAVREAVRDEVTAFVIGLGFGVLGVMPSPIEGGDGNVEYLIGARRG